MPKEDSMPYSKRSLTTERMQEQYQWQMDYETGPNGQLKPKKTTVGWEICVEFVDGSSYWLPLKDIKDSNPIELAEYAVANRIDQEPAFKWWASHVLRKGIGWSTRSSRSIGRQHINLE